MTTKTTDPTSFEFERIQFTASRDGDAVMGSARFPYAGAGGRTEIAIKYHRSPAVACCPLPVASSTDPAVRRRAEAVEHFARLRKEHPDASDRKLHIQVAELLDCSLNSVRGWVKSYELDGADGLADRYTARPRSTVHLDPAVARDAVIICAWWAFRIGGMDTIDGALINQAAGMLTRTVPGLIRAHRAASNLILLDVIAAIDCYFAWPCDRSRYPFKPFSRWVQHDFERWLLCAARKDADAGKQYTNDTPPGSLPVAPAGSKVVSLQTTETVIPPTAPDPRTRSREARWSQRRRAAVNHVPDTGKMVGVPTTLSEWLKTLDDAKCRMILSAVKTGAGGGSMDQVSATLPLWFESVPQAARNNIEFKLAAWHKDHPSATPPQLARWKANLLVSAIRMDWKYGAAPLGHVTDSIARKATVPQ